MEDKMEITESTPVGRTYTIECSEAELRLILRGLCKVDHAAAAEAGVDYVGREMGHNYACRVVTAALEG